jgi:phosphonate transport system permease protein
MSIIELNDARRTYCKGGEDVVALDGCSLQVEEGERLAVIGPSGSGKTTLMRVLAGLESLDEGEVRIDGRDPAEAMHAGPEAARDLGIVFQHVGLVPQLTALHNVLCGRLFDYDGHRSLTGFDEADRYRAASHLRRLGLGDRLYQRTSQLSGGERQRVGIARLLFQSPRVMLLDEPVSNLDVHWAAEAMRQIGEMRDGETTAAMVLHDLGAVRRWADRVALMRDGSLVFEGEPDEGCRRLEEMESTVDVATKGRVDVATKNQAETAPTSTDDPTPDAVEEALDRPDMGRRAFYGMAGVTFVVATIWSVLGTNVTPSALFGGLDGASSFLARLVPPDTSVASTVFESIVETIQMALIGTSLAAAASLPISVLAARNVSPKPLRAGARLLLNLLRTIPTIIWGLFFVAMAGLGPVSGILALTCYASGYLGKFYYEGIESIDPEPVRALRTVGANRIQQFRHGVFPQVLPLLVGYTLYMFEYNVREASVLGIVGAGGIGYYLYTYINNFQYPKATTALLMLLVVVTVIDVASSRLRRRIQDG